MGKKKRAVPPAPRGPKPSGPSQSGPDSSRRRMVLVLVAAGVLSVVAVMVIYPRLRSSAPDRAVVPVAADAAEKAPEGHSGHQRMVALLRDVVARIPNENFWLGDAEARVKRRRVAELSATSDPEERWRRHLELGLVELRLGNEAEAIDQLSRAHELRDAAALDQRWREITTFELGMAHMRYGETQNCSVRHSAESCILPIRGGGIHADLSGSSQAIRYFNEVLETAELGSPMHMKSTWLLNFAAMTLGRYPDGVPERYRIPPAVFGSEATFPHFENVAPALGLATFDLYGGAVVDDFDGDDYLDIVTTTFDPEEHTRYFRNQRDGTFVDSSQESGLAELYGGINVVQADYDNDGDLDLYILRGAWLAQWGKHPNSLVRNNGDGTFTDVTFDAGMAKVHYPTQTGAWSDYDNDGWVDLYVGNEHNERVEAPGQLFHNNRDGTFTDLAREAGVENRRYTKGVVWGDYDGDRWPDLYTSTLGGPNRLYHNNRDGTFTDLAPELGVTGPNESFPVWFWDYDNDGVLDLFVASYLGDKDSVAAVAASYLGLEVPFEKPHLYRGDGRGGFEEVGARVGLDRLVLAMGSNFGDLDNDGYLDFYLGTGYPDVEALMPNVMYHSVPSERGRRFVDAAYQGGFAHLQKGHSVAFADLDNDGDQDVFEQMGGIFPGDRFSDALFLNPGFDRHWLAVKLVGSRSNRAAIGARIRVDVTDGNRRRSIYRQVSSGGSFGSNPLRLTIGVGGAQRVELLEITWPTSELVQRFRDLPVDRFVRIVEGDDTPVTLDLDRLRF